MREWWGSGARWHEVPLPPLEGEVPNEREAEGFVCQLSVKPLSFATLSSSPFRGAKAAAPHGSPSWRPLQWLCKNITGFGNQRVGTIPKRH